MLRRRAVIACVAVALAGLLVMSGALALDDDEDEQSATGSLGTSDAAALAQAGRGDLDRTVELLQERLRDQPEDARSWATLGLAYVEQARVTGDPTYYPKADGVLATSLELQPVDNSLALAAQGALAAARHDFSGALGYARASLAINPYEIGALSIRVDALTELGRYAAALRALDLADKRRPSVQIFARYSYAAELRGRIARAAMLLQRAVDGVSNPADQAYLLSLLADLDRRSGRLAEAGAQLRTALQAEPGHVPALVSQARLAIAQDDVGGAVRLWREVVELVPLPSYLLELGELYDATGRPGPAAAQYAVLEATIAVQGDAGVSTDLDAARYLADHGSGVDALAAARAVWRDAPSIWSADALAWALHVNGSPAQALGRSREATRLGTPDALLWLHRGAIEAAAGLQSEALRHLRRGLALDPGLNPWQVEWANGLLDRLAASPDRGRNGAG